MDVRVTQVNPILIPNKTSFVTLTLHFSQTGWKNIKMCPKNLT